MSSQTRWIGSVGAAFERLTRVLTARGYRAPQPLWDGSDGNDATNIIQHYRADFDADEMEESINFARRYARERLHGLFTGLREQEAISTVFPWKAPMLDEEV